MIIKQRMLPKKIAAYETLLKRLPARHPSRQQVSDLLESVRAGYGGEVRVDEIMEQFDPPYPHLILQDLSLPAPYNCQIDTLIVTQSCLFLLEIKNMQGKLTFKSNPAALQQTKSDGTIKIHQCPAVQVRTALLKIERLLRETDSVLPILPAIIIAYPSQTVENPPADIRLLAASEINYYFTKIQMGKPLMSVEKMQELGNWLTAAHRDYNPFPILDRLGVNPGEVMTGVCCPNCRQLKMRYTGRRWKCGHCDTFSRTAQHEAIEEWLMLFKPTISARECQQFLGLTKPDAAQRLLKKHGLTETRSRKFRQYMKEH